MDAVKAMKFFALRPVGNRIPISGLIGKNKIDDSHVFQTYHPQFYNSGTSALASALLMARKKFPDKCEVLIPAYGCPDIVSAVQYAKLTPVVIDMQIERTFISIESLTRNLNEKTLAVIAVDLFGIQERIELIRDALRDYGVFIIEDSAQRAPWKGSEKLKGDYVVLSFGRGKPESVLHGGAVLVKKSLWVSDEKNRNAGFVQSSLSMRIQYFLKIFAYNLLLSPFLYWILLALPFISVGKTRYKKLKKLGRMSLGAYQLLCYKINKSEAEEGIGSYISQRLQNDFSQEVVNLPLLSEIEGFSQLLRYPILLPDKRTKLILVDQCRYLGVSEMYPSVLSEIEGLEWIKKAESNNAQDFASRLVTLPCHAGVKKKYIDTIFKQLHSLLSRKI